MMINVLLFGALPYVSVMLLVLVSILRYRRDPFTFSSLSSQFLETKGLFWGSVPFHLGVLTLFFVLFHSVTWFIAGAAVSPVQIGDFKVTVPMFVLGNMGLVVVVAAIIGYFTLGG